MGRDDTTNWLGALPRTKAPFWYRFPFEVLTVFHCQRSTDAARQGEKDKTGQRRAAQGKTTSGVAAGRRSRGGIDVGPGRDSPFD